MHHSGPSDTKDKQERGGVGEGFSHLLVHVGDLNQSDLFGFYDGFL